MFENMYSSVIPVDLAKRLQKFGMNLFEYPVGGYDGAPAFDNPGPDEPGWEDGHRYRIPTYGEVFDWFAGEKYIVITLEPFHTFSLKGHVGYTWKISYPDVKLGELIVKQEGDPDIWKGGGFGGSFKLTANDAIEYAMTITVESPYETVEVNIDELDGN